MVQRSKKLNSELEDPFYNSNLELLGTIKLPNNIHYLTDQLPRPNYEPLEHDANYKTDFGAAGNDSLSRSPRRNRGYERNHSLSQNHKDQVAKNASPALGERCQISKI